MLLSDSSSDTAVRCPVCFDSCTVEDSFAITTCGHRCCISCLRQYLHINIRDGKTSIRCLYTADGANPCPSTLCEAEIKCVADPETFRKFTRFVFNQQHPLDGRQCPHCDHSQVWSRGPQNQQECYCKACGGGYCFIHGGAHVGRSCEAYERAAKVHERHTLTVVSKTTKRCPGCGVPVEKSGGCNHMVCLRCGGSFCWICLALVDASLTPEHYQGWRLGGCAGLQHTDVDAFSLQFKIRRAILRGMTTLTVGLPALTITVLLTVATCGWYPLMRHYGVTFWGACSRCFELTATTIQDGYVQVGDGLARRSRETRNAIRGLFSPNSNRLK